MLIKRIFILPVIAVMFAGCASQVTETDQYSGFLRDYSKLEEVKSASGAPVLRWTNDKLSSMNYQKLQLAPVFYFPKPQASQQVNNETLKQVQQYIDRQLRAELGKSLQLTDNPGPNTLSMKVAITAVSADVEGLKPYEVVPIALVAAAASSASGARDRVATVYLEIEARDSQNGELMGQAVRKIQGGTLENDKTALTLPAIKAGLDTAAKDASAFFKARVN
jgi:hypothetical protein